jgi:hypothetical protein
MKFIKGFLTIVIIVGVFVGGLYLGRLTASYDIKFTPKQTLYEKD